MSILERGYRPELDGIRAVAVIAVLLFHLDFAYIHGGFTGVDVFFVLSGYLITGVILRQLEGKKFSVKTFLLRRIRRLLPANLFMVAVMLLAACFLMLPSALFSTAKSALVQPFSLQNLFFFLDGEYFQNASGKLFLHTWSLGVEERYYLFWPFALLVIFSWRRRGMLWATAAMIVGSFIFSLLVMKASPKAGFFLMPARLWELGLGGFLVMAQREWPILARRHTYLGVISMTGITGLLASFFLVQGGHHFPGWQALAPALSTLLILWGLTVEEGWLYRAMIQPVMVWVGKLSYSIYIWHWPLIVFARRSDLDIGNIWVRLAIIGLSVGMAWVSYVWIEEPIRRQRVFPTNRAFFGFLTALTMAILGLSVFIIQTEGLAFRYTPKARGLLTASFHTDGDERCGPVFRALQPNNSICRTGGVPDREGTARVLLWGNSHAAMWIGLFDALGREYGASTYLTSRNCRATTDHNFCDSAYQKRVLQHIEERGITDVVLISSWFGVYDIEDDVLREQLDAIVGKLQERDLRVWLSVDVPNDKGFSPSVIYEENPTTPVFGVKPWSEFALVRQKELDFFEELASKYSNLRVLDPTDAFCVRDEGCFSGMNDEVWYRDGDHITTAGAFRARDIYAEIFKSR